MPPEDELQELRAEVRRLRGLLAELTPPLEELLLRRGFKVHKKNPTDDLLLPAPDLLNEYYEFMKRYSFRLFLRDVILHSISKCNRSNFKGRFIAQTFSGPCVD